MYNIIMRNLGPQTLRTRVTAVTVAACIVILTAACVAWPSRLADTHATSSISPSILAPNVQQADMRKTSDPQLALLAQYEASLRYHFTSEMFFISMPRTDSEGGTQAADLANTLREYQKYAITPLIIMEPTDQDGGMIDLTQLSKPQYLHAFQSLLVGLKAKGITDRELGTLVPLPEPDLPEWSDSNTSPQLFAQNYAALGNTFKHVFPNAHLSLMLDSTVYTSGDALRQHGDMSVNKLLPYVTTLMHTPSLPHIDSIGFQGFPWSGTDTPADYLNASTAITLARTVGVWNIWLNTGTAGSYGDTTVTVADRSNQLHGVLAQAEVAKARGYRVHINIFGYEDKDVSWVYPLDADGKAIAPLSAFVQDSVAAGIVPALFVSPN